MCGIVGYVGDRDASEVLIAGLHRLEYRGYDSAGVAIHSGSELDFRKTKGRVADLAALVAAVPVSGGMGIGHTRWATHGGPTHENAHPHADCGGEIAVVHNGIIENARALRTSLENAGHVFRSETDTEVVAHLLEDAPGDTLEEKLMSALESLEGAYGLAVMWDREPGKIVVARKGSPVLIGVGEGETFVASDISAVVEYTRTVIYLDEGDVAVLTAAGCTVIDRDSAPQVRPVTSIDWQLEAIELNGYDHFMLKEIFEQPESVSATLRGRMLQEEGDVRLDGLNLTEEDVAEIRRIVIVACGTSWHAGLVGRHALEELAGIPVEVEYASEFRYRPRLAMRGTLVVAISQSGETADTLEAMRAAREDGARVIGIVNVVGSTIAREAEGGIYLHAGPEVGVASTKAFSSQIVALLLLSLFLGRRRGLPSARARELMAQLTALPRLIQRTLELRPEIEEIAVEFADVDHFLYLGRGVSFPTALEGALKLKEISYIHAEGYPAAEMKHGPIALIDREMPVVCIAPEGDLFQKALANVQEVQARGGRIIAVTTAGAGGMGDIAEYELAVPASDELLAPVLTSIPLQLLAYHIAVLRGCDVDKPRNLAKSVTVE